MMSDCPIDENTGLMMPELKKIYLEKMNDQKLTYIINNNIHFIHGSIQLNFSLYGAVLTDEILSTHKSHILSKISEQEVGVSHSCCDMLQTIFQSCCPRKSSI
jgi:hypothetical protein